MLYVFFALSLLVSIGWLSSTGGFSTLHFLWKLPLGFLAVFLGLLLVFCLVVLIACLFVNPKKDTERPSGFFRFLLSEFCSIGLFFGRANVHVDGLEKLPTDSRFLLVANHTCALDPVLFYHAMPRAGLSFLAKKEVFDLFLVSQIMRKVLCLPVDRENDREALKTILKAIQFLKEDKASIAVFPEGYTNKTGGDLLPFRNGVFRIAQKANVPVVVCCVTNCRKLLKNMFLRKTDVYLDVLQVIPAETFSQGRTNEVGDLARSIMQQGLEQRKALLS